MLILTHTNGKRYIVIFDGRSASIVATKGEPPMPHEKNLSVHYCPDCGKANEFFRIEATDPDSLGEYKDVCSCESCENIVYIVRKSDKGKSAKWLKSQTEK